MTRGNLLRTALAWRGIKIDPLQDQIDFGTSYPFGDVSETLEATLQLPLSRVPMEKYLWTNAARLLKLPAGGVSRPPGGLQ